MKTILSGHLVIAFFLSLALSAATAVAKDSKNTREEDGSSRLEQQLARQCGKGTEREAICKFRRNDDYKYIMRHDRESQKECNNIRTYFGSDRKYNRRSKFFPQATNKEECDKLRDNRYKLKRKDELEKYNKCMSTC